MIHAGHRAPAIVALLLASFTPAMLYAQGALDSLGDAAARETARFADRRAAVSDGYRRLGPDFPGMGEHWIHARGLVSGIIDASHPTLLTYAIINGRPTLTGVGFIVITSGGAEPTNVPGWPGAWHEHSGLLADESGAAPGRPSSQTHVWVLHVWSVLSNPMGRYAPDNWALPFVRAGLAVPPGIDADVGRAFSLVEGGDEYLRDMLIDAGLAKPESTAVIESVVASARQYVSAIATRAKTTGTLTPDHVTELRATWRALGDSLRTLLGASGDTFLAPSHAKHPHP